MSDFGSKLMDLEDPKPSSSSCSICLELVLDHGGRSIAKLNCGHDFHLDCIGSAFNAKGAMQCPNCRKVEKGRWLYANGHRSSSDFDFDGLMTEDFYDLSHSELIPFGFQWCPFRGVMQLASLFEEGESQLNSYHESLGHTTFRDQPSASRNSHLCPYLATLPGFPHHMHAAAPSSSSDSVPENNPFPRHPPNLVGGQPSADMLNVHSFPSAEPHNRNWQQQHSLPFSLNPADQSATQFAPRIPRSDTGAQHRLGSFVHPHPLVHGSVPRTGGNVLPQVVGPSVVGEARGPTHSRVHGSNNMYQHSMPSSALRSSPFPSIRRPRPRGVTLVSSLASTASAEVGGFYGFTSVSSSANGRSQQEAENIPRHFDRFYGWGGREGFTSLPWIPLEGEAQWWGPFNPNQAAQSGGNFAQRAPNAERIPQRIPPPPRRLGFM